MLKAAHETVMVTHIDEAEVDSLLQLRKEKKKFAEERGVKLTLLPFLLKACVIALKNYPYLNASLSGEEIILKNYYHFGFAVDTEAGLMVPVIRDVDQKSIMRGIVRSQKRVVGIGNQRHLRIAVFAGGLRSHT